MMYEIIQSNSKGNAVLYFDSILVDAGVSFKKVSPYLPKIKIALLSHIHSDHFNKKTIQIMQYEKPSLRFGCGEFLKEPLERLGIKNIDVLDYGKRYDYGAFQISPVKLYHDVPNYGYRIFKDDKRVFHATDTSTLEGIAAVGYDLYAIEGNYDSSTIDLVVNEQIESGEFAHGIRSKYSHLSIQEADDFVKRNSTKEHDYINLHRSNKYG